MSLIDELAAEQILRSSRPGDPSLAMLDYLRPRRMSSIEGGHAGADRPATLRAVASDGAIPATGETGMATDEPLA